MHNFSFLLTARGSFLAVERGDQETAAEQRPIKWGKQAPGEKNEQPMHAKCNVIGFTVHN